MRRANGLRVVSPAVKDFYLKEGIKCPIEVIPTASDYSLFSVPSQIPYKGGVGKKLILTDGRLEVVKNYPSLFKAIGNVKNEIDNIKLLVIGSGSLENKLKQQVIDMNLEASVEFLGSMPYDKLPAYYQACDVFVLASDSESLGKVLLQAGAAGKPVVATKTLGAKGIVKEGKTGYLVEIGDVDELAKKIKVLLKNKELRSSMGKQAQEYVLENYDSEKNIKKLIEFWKEIAVEKSNGSA